MIRPMSCVAVLAFAWTPRGADAADLEIRIDKLRSGKGQVHVCLTDNPAYFPDCAGDPRARKLTIKAAEARAATLRGVPQGTYALSLFHDENGNGRLDTFMKIPREGFGFSRNPVIRFAAPSFAAVRFDLREGSGPQSITMRYVL